MNPIIWIIIAELLGAAGYTIWSWAWKKLKEPDLPFDMNYLYSMLLAMLLGVVLLPFLLNNQQILDTLLPYILIGSVTFGFTFNSLFNTPLSYYMHQVTALRMQLKQAPLIKTPGRRILEVLGILALVACIAGASVYAVSTYSATIHTTGNITGVGVSIYSDSGGTVQISSIQWGSINPGDSNTVAIYVKNTGNVAITLAFDLTAWNPTTAGAYLTVSWNYQLGMVINPGILAKVDLTLTASSDAPQGTFSFDMVITAFGPNS